MAGVVVIDKLVCLLDVEVCGFAEVVNAGTGFE